MQHTTAADTQQIHIPHHCAEDITGQSGGMRHSDENNKNNTWINMVTTKHGQSDTNYNSYTKVNKILQLKRGNGAVETGILNYKKQSQQQSNGTE